MSRNVVKSEIDIIEIEDDDQTEVKQECEQTSQNIALECAPSELEQNYNPPAIDQTSLEAMLNPIDHPALTDCQPTLSSIINQLFDISEESIKEQKVAPNGDLVHLTSVSLCLGAVSSAMMENGCEINTIDNFHTTSEEAQVSDNGNTQLSQQNKVHTAVDQNAANGITATVTSVSISAVIQPLKRAKVPNKQIGSKVSKPPIALQEPVLDDEMPLKLRLRYPKQINYCDGDSKSRAHDSKKENHRNGTESKVKSNNRPKVRPQFKKKYKISHLTANIGPKRAVDGEMHHKCKHCHYATNNKSCFTEHMRTHTGEKPFKCRFCKFATAQRSNLIIHERVHSGEKPFKCRFCKYATAQSCSLIKHNRTHTGEKPYKCNQCSFASARPNGLQSHSRTHTGEKPYKCIQCSYASAEAGTLRKHMRTHV